MKKTGIWIAAIVAFILIGSTYAYFYEKKYPEKAAVSGKYSRFFAGSNIESNTAELELRRQYLKKKVNEYKKQKPIIKPSAYTPDDAYNVGYDEGYEAGVSDAIEGKMHGESYNDDTDFYGYYETRYCEGYEEGYDDGYALGK